MKKDWVGITFLVVSCLNGRHKLCVILFHSFEYKASFQQFLYYFGILAISVSLEDKESKNHSFAHNLFI